MHNRFFTMSVITLLCTNAMAQIGELGKSDINSTKQEGIIELQTEITTQTTNFTSPGIGISNNHNLPLSHTNQAYYDNRTNKFGGNQFVFLEAEQKQYINLASYHLLNSALGLRITKRVDIAAGILAIKQFNNTTPYGADRAGVKFMLNYNITNQLKLKIWSQLITGSEINMPEDHLLPQTETGASMMLNIGSGSQIGVDTQYRYDEKRVKWDSKSGAKVKIKF